eukprot:GFUD01027277.1.p1 GENE.GFUD01027277.1~~GFUD01027277.1.p1  ORF type:complete len:333 (-),score=60.14 GFUD01027277.1:59-1057(-)
MSSTSHENMLKVVKGLINKDELVEYHESILSRIYPKESNVFSGNFNPIPHWKTGVQIAALNIQTTGPYLRINSSMFRQNGNSGYVLKPCLKMEYEGKYCLLKINILEARHISSLKPQKEIFHTPHVRVELFGETESDGKIWNTNDDHKKDETLNGFHPVWNTRLEPHLVGHKDMAFLEFSLTEMNSFGDNATLAFCMVKLSNVKNGVRSLTLWNERCKKYPLAVLVVDISILSWDEIIEKENFCKIQLEKINEQKKVPRLSLEKRVQLKKEKENMVLDLLDILNMQISWEKTSNRKRIGTVPVRKAHKRTPSLPPQERVQSEVPCRTLNDEV